MTTPSTAERWREAVDAHLARRARTAALREQLAEARTAGKLRRHQERLRRAGQTTREERP